MRIELCGPLGVGKTTLAVNLSEGLGLEILREPVETHPFLAEFYARPADFAFEKNLFFLLDYLHQVKRVGGSDVVFDHSPVVHRAYAIVNKSVSPAEKPVFAALDTLIATLPPPDLLIHLVCAPDIVMQRIRTRGRQMESSVGIDYVTSLADEMARQVDGVRGHMRVLDLDAGAYDLVASAADNDRVVSLIRDTLNT